MGDSNGLEARVSVTEAAAKMTGRFPNKFVFFCNEIPDLEGPTQKNGVMAEKRSSRHRRAKIQPP